MAKRPRFLKRWVLTGPVGAGKSQAAACLADLGAHIVDADAEGHVLLQHSEVITEIAAAFGPMCLVNGQIDRSALGRRVFANPVDLARLNRIMHGRLSTRLTACLDILETAAVEPGLAVVEAAVYFLLPSLGTVDLIVTVTAPPQVRIERLVSSGRFDERTARARVEGQRDMLTDYDRADVILDNANDPAALKHAVTELYRLHMDGAAPGG